jgi:hypothetical protein
LKLQLGAGSRQLKCLAVWCKTYILSSPQTGSETGPNGCSRERRSCDCHGRPNLCLKLIGPMDAATRVTSVFGSPDATLIVLGVTGGRQSIPRRLMEKLRTKLDQDDYHNLIALGRSKSGKSGKGIVSEDLGRTEFKTSCKTNNRKSSTNPRTNTPKEDDNSDSEEDDIDLISHGSPSPPRLPVVRIESKASKKSQASFDL